MHCRILAVVFAMLPCWSRAQATASPPREPQRGTVLLADGQPWAGAQVELWSRPLPGDDRFGEADVVRAVSDAKGRFLVELLPGRRYTAWASVRLEGGGSRVSHPLDEVRPGRPLDLVADEPRPPGIVHIEGLDAWRPLGAIECRLLSNTTNLIVAVCPEKDGKLQLPLFPGRNAGLEILCGGWPLFPLPSETDLTRKEPHKVQLPPPRSVCFRFTDAVTGMPIAGASFSSSTLGQRDVVKELSQSDADGLAKPLLPIDGKRNFDPVNYPVFLQARGHAPLSWIERMPVPVDHDAAAGKPVAVIAMQPGCELQSKVTIGGVACAGMSVRVQNYLLSSASTMRGWHATSWPVRTDAEGNFRTDVDPEQVAALTAVLDEATVAKLAQKTGRYPPHPQVLLAVVPPGAPAPVLPREIDVAKLVLLDVQVKSPDGAPADSPLVGCCCGPVDMSPPPLLVSGTDRSGRIRLLVPAGQEFWLAAWSEDGCDVKEVPRADAAVRPIGLELKPVKALAGVVEDKGRPVPWAQLTWFVSADGGAMALFTSCLLNRMVVRTDGKGSFSMPLYPGVKYHFSSVMTPEGTHHPHGPEFTAGKDEPEQLRIELQQSK